jgi:hypothetical protein
MAKRKDLPVKYQEGFLRGMDRRTEIAGRLRGALDAILSDIGNPNELTHARKVLCERFVFLEYMLGNLEAQIAKVGEDNPKAALKMFGWWTVALNSAVGLARSAGLLSRNAKPVVNLREYVRSNRVRERKDSM